jgi:hypothetical protein
MSGAGSGSIASIGFAVEGFGSASDHMRLTSNSARLFMLSPDLRDES